MNLTEKNKFYLIGAVSLGVILVLVLLIGEIVLPFVFALLFAHLLNPIVLKIQKKVRNRFLALTSFLFVVTSLFIGIIFFFGGHIVKDSKRLVSSVEVFTQKNEQHINDLKNSLITFVTDNYDSEAIKAKLKQTDTTENKEKLVSSLESVYSFFEKPDKNKADSKRDSWSSIYMLIFTILYTVIILYSYDYFENKYTKYFSNRKPIHKKLAGILSDFKITFINYFTQRTKVVFLNIVILISAFTIMDLPGAIIIGIITGVLSYASQFHYMSLPLVGIGCWILSIENDTNFFIYFGIISAVFILISILEETLYFEKIMKSVKGMNSAIILVSFTLWIFVFGGFTGTIIALPLTQLILIYMDRLLLFSKDKLNN